MTNKPELLDLEKIRKNIRNLNQELTNVIGHKSMGGIITINGNTLIRNGWIEFDFSKKLTKNEKEKVIKILEKYFGKILDNPRIIKRYKTEKGKYGYRYDTYEFFSYTKIKDKPLFDIKPKRFLEWTKKSNHANTENFFGIVKD